VLARGEKLAPPPALNAVATPAHSLRFGDSRARYLPGSRGMQQSLGRCEPCFLRAHWKSGYLRSGPGPCVLFPFFVRHPRNGSVAEALELKVDVGFQAMAVLLAVAGPQPKIQGAGPAPNPEAASAHFDGSLGAHRQGRCRGQMPVVAGGLV